LTVSNIVVNKERFLKIESDLKKGPKEIPEILNSAKLIAERVVNIEDIVFR
jgi:hypothetical protein